MVLTDGFEMEDPLDQHKVRIPGYNSVLSYNNNVILYFSVYSNF